MRATLAFLAASLVALTASALPPTQSDDDRVDDTRLTLSLQDRFINGDRASFCRVRIQIAGEDVPLSENDEVLLWVYENDFVGDETLWETTFRVTAAEAAAQVVDRSYNCGSDFGEDPGDFVEIYADSEVRKEECGTFCLYDRPETAALEVRREDDDAAENDDASDRAGELPLGQVGNRIGRDQDWFSVDINGHSDLTFTAFYRDAWGRLDVTLYDGQNNRLVDGVDGDGATTLIANGLAPGAYRVRVQPRDGGNYNYYDIEARLRDAGCDPGVVEEVPCGNCGGRRRTCQDDATWGEYGACENEGPCAPGDEREVACGNCGEQFEVCGGNCAWRQGGCENQGPCAPGNTERDACDGAGSRERTCDEMCAWGDWSMCSECDEGAVQPCYDGPAGTAGIGECSRGQQRCVGGAWRECEGQVLPSAELCGDAADGDCDGLADSADDDCQDPPAAGDPCVDAVDCGGELVCLSEDDHSVWVDGYCTVLDCDTECPGDAACAPVFGERLCVKRCNRPLDCRPGYVCADLGVAGMGCIPRCRGNDDCDDPDWPRCDASTGVCVAPEPDAGVVEPEEDMGVRIPDAGGPEPGGSGGAGGAPAVDAGVSQPDEPGKPVGCDCRADGTGSTSWWMMGVLLLGLRRRRRGPVSGRGPR